MLAKETFDSTVRTYRQLLPVPLSVAKGEMLYSIREANPESYYFFSPDISRPLVIFHLEKRHLNEISPGDSGRIALWASGEQTFCEISKPVCNSKRFAVWYLLTRWRHTTKMQITTAHHGAWFSLTGKIMDHVLDHDPTDELIFKKEDMVTEEFITCTTTIIQNILSKALGIQVADSDDEYIKRVTPFILDAFSKINWQSEPNYGNFSEPSLLQSILHCINAWCAKEEKTDDLHLLTSLTPDEKRKCGFDRITELVQQCVDATYKEQLEFHKKVIAFFFDRIYKSEPISNLSPLTAYQTTMPSLDRLSLVSNDLIIMEMRRNGNTASETGLRISKSEKTVYNRINALRKLIIEEYGKAYADILIPSCKRSKKRIGEST